MSVDWIAISVNLAIFVCVVIGATCFLFRLKLDVPGFRILFVFYTLFWIPLMLVRPYRAAMHLDVGGESQTQWIPLVAYGLVGILLRPLFDWTGAYLRSRKTIIYVALILQVTTFLPVIIAPSITTNVIQAVGVGIGASCIGSFSLWFNEQHAKTRPFLTISVLSLPPLIADFISAPMRSLILSAANSTTTTATIVDPNISRYLWVAGLIVLICSCTLGFFVREQRQLVGLQKAQQKPMLKTNKQLCAFGLLILVGASIDFIKFASADAVAVQTLHALAKNQSTSAYEGYLSAIFSICQLAGGLLMGWWTNKNVNKLPIYSLGAGAFVLYATTNALLSTYATGTVAISVYMSIQTLNGFAYGITYNLLIAHALSLAFKTKRLSPLGIYQMVAGIAIAGGGFFAGFIAGGVSTNHTLFIYALTGMTLGLVFFGLCTYTVANHFLTNESCLLLWRWKSKQARGVSMNHHEYKQQ